MKTNKYINCLETLINYDFELKNNGANHLICIDLYDEFCAMARFAFLTDLIDYDTFNTLTDKAIELLHF